MADATGEIGIPAIGKVSTIFSKPPSRAANQLPLIASSGRPPPCERREREKNRNLSKLRRGMGKGVPNIDNMGSKISACSLM